MLDFDKIKNLTQRVLNSEFPDNREKSRTYLSVNKFNFSCPYCRDSAKDPRKKRGYIFLDTLHFKCFNGGCGVFRDILQFFEDWNVSDDITSEEKVTVYQILQDNKKHRISIQKVDLDLFFEKDINEYLVPRDSLLKKMGWTEVKGTPAMPYLLGRFQTPDKRFAWDPHRKKLILFNLNSDETLVLGMQTRKMDDSKMGSKYLTYKLSKIWSSFMEIDDEIFLNDCIMFEPISTIFGIANLRFDEKITIFEGPMDSWLFPNSVGLCSIENKFPFDIDNKRHFLDFDKTGIEKSMSLLAEGEEVFLWTLFIKENNLPENRKWDLNSLVMYLRKNEKKVKRLENYFSSEKWDMINV
jgi:hypothetical protein